MAIYAISQSLMAKLASMHKNGFQATRSPDKKKRKTKTYIAKAWMESSFQKMGDKMPDSPIIHLPCYLDFRIFYRHMVDDLSVVGDPVILYPQFSKMMKHDFPDVSIPRVGYSYIYLLIVVTCPSVPRIKQSSYMIYKNLHCFTILPVLMAIDFTC